MHSKTLVHNKVLTHLNILTCVISSTQYILNSFMPRIKSHLLQPYQNPLITLPFSYSSTNFVYIIPTTGIPHICLPLEKNYSSLERSTISLREIKGLLDTGHSLGTEDQNINKTVNSLSRKAKSCRINSHLKMHHNTMKPLH